MSRSAKHRTQDAAEPRTRDELRADIESTRQDLAHTVEALTAKTDVRKRAGEKAAEVRGRVEAVSHDAAARVRRDPVPVGVAAGVMALLVLLILWRRAR